MTTNHSIPRLEQVDDRIATAGQPSEHDILWLRDQGYEAIVNISTPDARNFVHNEANTVLAAGMTYVHAPVNCSALVPAHYHLVRGVLDGLKGKRVLFHCAGNVKASGLMHIYRVKELGHDRDRSLSELRERGWHEPKWFAFFEKMGV